MLPPRDYDEAITIFSPDGRLYQVEYAMEMVNRGAPIVGVFSPEGVVLAANETPASSLEESDLSRKIFQLDDHMGAAISGLFSDARVLIERARLICQWNRLHYDEVIDAEPLVMRVGDLLQVYTQYAGVRPFGVSMIVAGVDHSGCRILTTDPTGNYRGYFAVAMGQRSGETNKMLEEHYRDDLTLDEATALAIEAVKSASKGEVTSDGVKVAVIPAETRIFRRLTEMEIEKHLSRFTPKD
ncbi:hypothetical protein AC482_01215 [miscellaneous Crenarchaeota group-15 archaeon DG-45]|uniref:Proteasome alpha-type subunits domain-containing protein n=1 Tax=miscellaneous Crenarchaeota group-15 archaeon DG-45 TaxID=1685127 RepID=A0A0M0BSI0_9ARCH|nr:MAG: hypothetical protein AC482_01215 [miscellaneous Crenarchaeota group-15 archaeon DG-45]